MSTKTHIPGCGPGCFYGADRPEDSGGICATHAEMVRPSLDVERLARAYHAVNCPKRRVAAFHSCGYQRQHRATATALEAAYSEVTVPA